MPGEPLKDRQPNHIRRQSERQMPAESQMHRAQQSVLRRQFEIPSLRITHGHHLRNEMLTGFHARFQRAEERDVSQVRPFRLHVVNGKRNALRRFVQQSGKHTDLHPQGIAQNGPFGDHRICHAPSVGRQQSLRRSRHQFTELATRLTEPGYSAHLSAAPLEKLTISCSCCLRSNPNSFRACESADCLSSPSSFSGYRQAVSPRKSTRPAPASDKPTAVHTEESNHRKAIFAENGARLLKGDYDGLEKAAQEFRTSKEAYFHGYPTSREHA